MASALNQKLLAALHYRTEAVTTMKEEKFNEAMELFTQVGAKMYAQKVLARKELLKA